MSSATASTRLATPSIFTRTIMLGIMGTLSAYLASWENADRLRDTYLEKSREYGDTFDFIIVGAGTAGAIIANRLSDKYKVLLLEAGGEPHPFQAIPLLSNYLLNYAQLDWRHVTMPQKQAFRGSVQSRASISQGRGLGGTTNLDYMMYLRGHPKDFDNWAEILEDASWSYKSVSEYFKSLEQYAGPWAPENHGDSGELKIRPPAFTGLGQKFCEAAESNGYRQTDLNSLFTEGCDIINYPTKKGYRDSVFNSFLRRIKDRWNLAIHKYGHVNKILIRGNNDTAYGVEYDRHGKSMVAYAKKEVIIAAGALQTPKILMLSGIGPKSDLDSIGIPVKADLPVGKNLQDHLSVHLGPFFVEKGRSLDIDRDVSTGSVLSLAKDSGPLTTTGFQAAAIVSSGLEKLHGGRNWPDLQLTMYGLAHHKSVETDLNHAYRLKKDLLQTYLEHSKGLDSFSIVVSGGRPKSTGTVKLLNRNPYAPLIINPNYFDKIYDVVVMVDGVKKALRIVENSTALYTDLNARFTRQILPGCESYRYRSDAYFECFVRTMSVSMGNVAGTAAMGSVLDSKLRVKGIKSLRVMDASAMPQLVVSQSGATVMMIAEKGADMLLTEYEGTGTEARPPKDTNVVADTQTKVKAEGSKSILDTLKLAAAADNKLQPLLQKLNLNDLQKLTKSVGSLATLLDPVTATGSVQNNVYTGSFDLRAKNDSAAKFNPVAAIASLSPRLKSQIGGLYQNLFESAAEASKQNTEGKKSSSAVSSSKLPLGQLGTGNPLYPGNSPDPMQLIQGLIQSSMKELENITALSSVVGTSLKTPDKNKNMTLDDIFGIIDDDKDAFEDYFTQSTVKTTQTTPKSATTTRKSVKTTKLPSSTTTRKPTSKPTTKPTTRPTTTTVATSKRPFIDYTYEVLPVPLTQSTDVSHISTQSSSSHNVPSKPIYPGLSQIQTIAIQPAPIPFSNVQSFKVPPVPAQFPGKVNSGPPSQKLKNLEALELIQHETLAKLRQKQHPKPPTNPPHTNLPFQSQAFRHPPPPLSQQMLQHQHSMQYPHYPQSPQFQGQPASPSLNILPPPPSGRFPPSQQYFQKPDGTSPHHQHPVFSQILKPVQSHPPPSFSSGLLRPHAQPPADPSHLKSAIHSIMHAKYAPPTRNPFQGVINNFNDSPNQQQSQLPLDNGVLKSLQLRANVDKLIHIPLSLAPVSPIPITHRPTPPPPTQPSTIPPPPPPMGPEQLREENGDIFAPIKDMLQPLKSISSFMRGPLSLLPNPFKTETETTTRSSIASSLLPSFLTSSIFSQRLGPVASSYEPSESQPFAPSSVTEAAGSSSVSAGNKNPLSVVLPSIFMNQSDFNGDISPEQFLLALTNMTTDLPKPFVLDPSKAFPESSKIQQQQQTSLPGRQEGKKHLDDSISEILSQLQNHHFASLVSSNSDSESDDGEELPNAFDGSLTNGNHHGANSANEILNLDYKRFPTTVKASVPANTPKVKPNPPIEFHKSIWAKEPVVPSKSLHFKIKIV